MENSHVSTAVRWVLEHLGSGRTARPDRTRDRKTGGWTAELMDRVTDKSPILVADADTAIQRVVVSALEAEGFRCCLSRSNGDAVKVDEQPLALVDGGTTKHVDPWLAYANRGGTLVLISPNREVATELGLNGYDGTLSRAVL